MQTARNAEWNLDRNCANIGKQSYTCTTPNLWGQRSWKNRHIHIVRHNTEKKREKKEHCNIWQGKKEQISQYNTITIQTNPRSYKNATELRMHMWIVELTFQLRERRIPANGLSLPITGSIPQDCFAHHLNPVIHFRVTFQDSAHKRKGAVQTPHTCSIYKILSNTKRGKNPKEHEREKKKQIANQQHLHPHSTAHE